MRRMIIVVASFLSVILAGCNVGESGSKIEENKKILENVWEYVQTTDMPQGEVWKTAWLNGEIEEREITENNKWQIDEKYVGKTVLLISPANKEKFVAYPTIVVDSRTKEVIYVVPGA